MRSGPIARREFVVSLSGAFLGWSCAVGAETPKRGMLRVGIVSAINPRSASFWVAFDQQMRELGYVEGRNLTIEFINLGGRLDRFEEETQELVGRKVDVIIASGFERALKAALAATDTLPIVMVAIDYDPFALGYVTNLARPGGNITGVFFQQIELTEKRVHLLKDVFPDLMAATVMWDRISADQWQSVQRLAPRLGLQLSGIELGEPPYDFDRVLAQGPRNQSVILVLMTPQLFPVRASLAAAAIRHRKALVCGMRPYVEAGCLLSYGPSIDAMYRRVAHYVDQIAKGAKPGDLPIEQPTKFELVVNLKTAKSLGLTISEPFLSRADEVIE